jgi:hypothetical protein
VKLVVRGQFETKLIRTTLVEKRRFSAIRRCVIPNTRAA